MVWVPRVPSNIFSFTHSWLKLIPLPLCGLGYSFSRCCTSFFFFKSLTHSQMVIRIFS